MPRARISDEALMAWSGKPPYHGLGVEVPVDSSVDQMLEAAGLNWPVEKVSNHVPHTDADGKTVFRRVEDSFALVRGDNPDIILTPYVGNRYKPVQNDDAFETFTDFVRKGDMHLDTAGSLDEGRRIWCLAFVKEGFRLAGGDEVKGYLLLSQSHSYGSAMRVMFTPVRVQGMTTFVEALRGRGAMGQFTMPHSRHFDEKQVEKIKQTVNIAKARLREFRRKATTLADSYLSEADRVRYFMEVFQPDLLRNMVRDEEKLPDTISAMAEMEGANRNLKKVPGLMKYTPGMHMRSCDGTMWGAFSAVLYYYDHVYGRGVDSRLESSWFGKNANEKAKALNTIVHMAENGGALPGATQKEAA